MLMKEYGREIESVFVQERDYFYLCMWLNGCYWV